MLLAELRKSKGYSQKEFAESIGIPVSTYNQYENGNRSIPAEIASKICEILGVNYASIFLASSFTIRENDLGIKEVKS